MSWIRIQEQTINLSKVMRYYQKGRYIYFLGKKKGEIILSFGFDTEEIANKVKRNIDDELKVKVALS